MLSLIYLGKSIIQYVNKDSLRPWLQLLWEYNRHFFGFTEDGRSDSHEPNDIIYLVSVYKYI